MNCQEAKQFIHAYLDGELDATHSMAMETHLRECAVCARIRQDQQLLKSALGESALQFKIPAALRRTIVSELRQTARPEPRPRSWFSMWLLGGTTAFALLLILFLAMGRNEFSARERLMSEISSSHVRSMMASHLRDVVSTDRHTVKPWFDGKLDFAPPVKDLAPQGFPLSGGRLDYLAGRQSAALIYTRQKHVINLFIWPDNAPARTPVLAGTRNGYHLVNWTDSSMTFWAVSDLNEKELLDFAEAFQKN